MDMYQIPANELRIGNRIAIPCCASHATIAGMSKEAFDIEDDEIDLFGDDLKGFPITEAYGIELFPNILKQCGDIYNSCTDELTIGAFRLTKQVPVSFTYTMYVHAAQAGFVSAYSISYLHQLQNLYFSLTGEELSINLTANQSA